MSTAQQAGTQAGYELVITRSFDAPRRLVFAAWAKPEHQVHWMGLKDFTVPSCDIDFRPGGSYRTCIRSPEGNEVVLCGTYREIVEPSRLVFTFAWEGKAEGERGSESLVTLDFIEIDGKTRLVLRQAPFPTADERDGHNNGWTQALDRLDAYMRQAA
jgi:uncharacterized protein YndB with AHSA1/START domain